MDVLQTLGALSGLAFVWLALTHPIATLVVVIVLLANIAWMMPKIMRLFRRNLARLRSFVRGGSV